MEGKRVCPECNGAGFVDDAGSAIGRAFIMGVMAGKPDCIEPDHVVVSEATLENAKMTKKIRALELTLAQIARKEGRFELDHHKHAMNCIENMANLAENALRGEWDLEVKVKLDEEGFNAFERKEVEEHKDG